jgi:SAM-dependent methyltransferase
VASIATSTNADHRKEALTQDYVALLRSPRSGQRLHLEGRCLVTREGGERYELSPSGVPQFAVEFLSAAARSQQSHYDGMVAKYVENLGYPHTQEYSAYLDRQLFDLLPAGSLGTVAELCCGRGEAARLREIRAARWIGVDVSAGMLEIARRDLPGASYFFVQGDATMLPLADRIADNVIMLGGIHHVPDRLKLFAEVHRILKPGGAFYFREPLDDFLLWRAIRKAIYRVSPALDHTSERPLRREETEPPLVRAGLKLEQWRTYGFAGFCLLMNSDVLVFNRLFRFVPGIRAITRAACRIDHWTTTSVPGLRGAGLQVIGVARRAAAG